MGNQDRHCYQCKHRHKLYCEKPCNACNGNPNVVKGKDNFTELEGVTSWSCDECQKRFKPDCSFDSDDSRCKKHFFEMNKPE